MVQPKSKGQTHCSLNLIRQTVIIININVKILYCKTKNKLRDKKVSIFYLTLYNYISFLTFSVRSLNTISVKSDENPKWFPPQKYPQNSKI